MEFMERMAMSPVLAVLAMVWASLPSEPSRVRMLWSPSSSSLFARKRMVSKLASVSAVVSYTPLTLPTKRIV